MTRASLLWLITAGCVVAGTFHAVRGVFPAPSAVTGSATSAAETPSSGKGLASPTAPEDPLLKRLRFLDRLGVADPSDLRGMLQGRDASRQEKQAVAQRWAETDPAGLLGYLKGLSRTDWDRDREQFEGIRSKLFRTWAAQDPDAALAAADALGNRPQFRMARWEIVETLFRTDPAKAFEAAVKLPRYQHGVSWDESVWAEDPAAFLKAAGSAPSGALRSQMIQGIVEEAFGALLKQNSGAAAAWLTGLPPEQQRQLWPILAYQLAESDPVGAQAWFANAPPSAEREKAGAAIVKSLAAKDPHAALEWLQDHLQGGRTDGFAHVAEALAEKGVEAAKALLDAMPPGVQRDGVVAVVARQWARTDFKQAIDWVLSLPPDDPGRIRAMERMSDEWPEKDLPGAAAFLATNPESSGAPNLMSALIRQFVHQDVAGGFAWAEALPENSRMKAYNGLFNAGFAQEKLPQVYAAMGKLPFDQQTAIVGKIAGKIMTASYSDGGMDARYLNSLKQIPEPLRPAAREAIRQSAGADAAKKQAALAVLE